VRFVKLNVHRRSGDLNNLSDIFCHGSLSKLSLLNL
jgi:hypothetical protein